MCDCDCELPKRERWQLIKNEHAKELAKRVLELRSHVSGSRRNRAFDGGYLAGLIAAALEIESPREEKA